MKKDKSNLKAAAHSEIKRALVSCGLNATDTLIRKLLLAEGFLNFCHSNAFDRDYQNLYSLLSNLHKLGRNSLDSIHFYLDNLRNNVYYPLSSKTYYNEIISEYLKMPEQIRMYGVKNNSIVYYRCLSSKLS